MAPGLAWTPIRPSSDPFEIDDHAIVIGHLTTTDRALDDDGLARSPQSPNRHMVDESDSVDLSGRRHVEPDECAIERVCDVYRIDALQRTSRHATGQYL